MQRIAAVAACIPIIGPYQDGLVETLQGRLVPLQRVQCAASVIVGFGILRVQLDDLVKALHRFLVSPHSIQSGAAAEAGLHKIRPCRECPVDQFQRQRSLSNLVRNRPQQMQRIRLLGSSLQ